MASSGSAKSLHARRRVGAVGGERAARPLPAGERRLRAADLLGAHAVEIIILRIVLADVVEAQEPPAPGPSKLAGWSGALNSPGAPQPGTAHLALAPSIRPCILDCFVAITLATPLYRAMNAQKPARSRAKCCAGSIRRFRRSGIELTDDSEQHRGHGGYNPAGESHFSLRIESPAFAGKIACRAPADDLCRARRPHATSASTPCRSTPGAGRI